jgi:hypothetical protein
MGVSVLVPWRPGCPHREAGWAYTRAWWGRAHPDWQVVAGACPDGPWVKAHAVADALCRADGDIVVIADADVLCDGVGQAVDAVRAGAPWATPHRAVYRLTDRATAAVLAGAPWPDVGGPRPAGVGEWHKGVGGGGITVLPRAVYERVPLDPRFVGWGQEDTAFGFALTVMAGPPWRGVAPILHLWHPPAPRMSRPIGSREGVELNRRYRTTPTPTQMAALLAEIPTAVC